MANTVQKYVNSRQCCFSNSIHTSDKKIKYGLEQVKCQIIKDTIADIYMEVLSCDPIPSDEQWYRMELDFEWIQDMSSPVSLPGYFIISDDPTVTSYDGLRSITIPMAGTYYANDMIEVNQIITQMWENTNTADFIISVDTDPITGISKIIAEHTGSWGTPDDIFNAEFFQTNGFNGVVSNLEHIEITSDNRDCLSYSQMCSIKKWLDAYCYSC
jgi:hypothetical protein